MAVVPNPRAAASYLGINARLDSVRTDLLTGPPRAENTSVDQGLQTDALTPPPPTVHPLHLPLHNPRSCQRRMGPRGHRPIISRASRCYNRSTQGPSGVIQSAFSDFLWNVGNSRQKNDKMGAWLQEWGRDISPRIVFGTALPGATTSAQFSDGAWISEDSRREWAVLYIRTS